MAACLQSDCSWQYKHVQPVLQGCLGWRRRTLAIRKTRGANRCELARRLRLLEFERPVLLKDTEVCQLLGIGRSKYYELLGNGGLPAPIRMGRAVRISRVALERWIEDRQAQADAQREGR